MLPLQVQLILNAHVKAELGPEYAVRLGIQDEVIDITQEQRHAFEFINLVFALVPILLASRIITERAVSCLLYGIRVLVKDWVV